MNLLGVRPTRIDIRRVERAWRAAWMRGISALLPGPRAIDPPDWTARLYRVLLLRYERIGDLVMATGLIRVLARSHNTIALDVVVSPASAPVLESNPHVQRVITLDRRSWSSYQRVAGALRRARYDVVVDGRLNHPAVYTSTPFLLLASGARYRIGAGAGTGAPAVGRGAGGAGGADRVYNINVGAYDRTVHYIEGSKALARPFGVDADAVDWQPELFLTGAERARAESVWRAGAGGGGRGGGGGASRLLANLSASEPRRRWADEHFITVLRDIRARRPDVSIVVIGLPAEWDRVSSVAAAVGARAAPTPRLREAFALVGTSTWVLTPDTSISHAASAFHRPVVVLLKRDHYPYAPWNTPSELVFWDGDTIAGLRVEPVLAAVRRLFG